MMENPSPPRTTTVHKVFHQARQDGFEYFYHHIVGKKPESEWWRMATGELFNMGWYTTEGSRVGEQIRRTLLGL